MQKPDRTEVILFGIVVFLILVVIACAILAGMVG